MTPTAPNTFRLLVKTAEPREIHTGNLRKWYLFIDFEVVEKPKDDPSNIDVGTAFKMRYQLGKKTNNQLLLLMASAGLQPEFDPAYLVNRELDAQLSVQRGEIHAVLLGASA